MNNNPGQPDIAIRTVNVIGHVFSSLLHGLFVGSPTVPMVVGMAVVIASAYVRYRFSRTTLTPAIEVRGDLIYERNYWRRHFREALRQLAVLFTVIGGIVFLIGLYRHF